MILVQIILRDAHVKMEIVSPLVSVGEMDFPAVTVLREWVETRVFVSKAYVEAFALSLF